MAHCFYDVDNFDGKFVKAIIESPFTGEFVTDGWLPIDFFSCLWLPCLQGYLISLQTWKPRAVEEITKIAL